LSAFRLSAFQPSTFSRQLSAVSRLPRSTWFQLFLCGPVLQLPALPLPRTAVKFAPAHDMSVEKKTELRFEIAHILFIDIVGFSKLLIEDQTEALEELNEVVRKTDAFRSAEAAGQLIRLPTGD